MSTPPSRRVVIDRLVLEGLDLTPEQVEAFRHRLASELEKRLAEFNWSMPLSSKRAESMPTEAIELTGPSEALSLATDVAARLADSLMNAG